MGCGASSAGGAAEPTNSGFPPPPTDPESGWALTVPVDDLGTVTGGEPIPTNFLVIHDNKKGNAPRLSVVNLADGVLRTVQVEDEGLSTAKDLECLFVIDAAVAGETQNLYVTMTSIGAAFLFKVSLVGDTYIAHDVYPFQLLSPVLEDLADTNCEGARAYVDNGTLFLEYASRGGLTEDGRKRIPWVARMPFDITAIKEGSFACDPNALELTFWPATIAGDPKVRQCSDLGQAVGMAKYGQLYAAAYDDEATETFFRSYILQRVPGAENAEGVEQYVALFIVKGAKIEAIMDLTPAVSIFATDDESRGAFLTVFNRFSGYAWKLPASPPEGADPRLYGISGIAPLGASDGPVYQRRDEEGGGEDEGLF